MSGRCHICQGQCEVPNDYTAHGMPEVDHDNHQSKVRGCNLCLDREEVTFQGRLAASMERHRHILDRLKGRVL